MENKDYKNNKIKFLTDNMKHYLMITLATIGYGFGIAVFLDKNNLVPGGVSGLSIIISKFTGINTGTIILMINIPIIILGIRKLGLHVIADSIYTIIISGFAINIFEGFKPITDDILISSIAGGVIVAFCLGVILKRGATTGGMDIIVMIVKSKYRHVKTGNIFLMTDAAIVFVSAFAFEKIEYAFYSAITVVISSLILDMVLYGRDEARLIYIVLKENDFEELLAQKLLMELGVGVTYLRGYGAYKNTDKKVIMCAVHKNLLPKAKEIVKETDDNAFLIVTSANEIIGEGYKSHYSKNL